MEIILFGLLMVLWGLSMFFAKDFWWGIQEFTNQTRGLASERTEMWEISQNFIGFMIVSIGFIFMYFGVEVYQIRSQPVIPLVCPEPNTNLSVKPVSGKSEIDRYIKIACAAAKKKDYQIALTNFKQALDISDRLNRAQNTVEYVLISSDLRYAIAQMEKQLKN